ncbi:MAG: hypothetical protein IMZ46_16420 [Acidobacteria bacterium]|nr:hypothetical protein [Acidobacteriota bacterium]
MPDIPEIPDEMKAKIIKALEGAGVALPCPRCGNVNFSLIGGYFNQFLQPRLGGIVIGGPSIPSIGTVCIRCGFIAQHALGPLGLMPTKAEVKTTPAPPAGEVK